MFTPTHQLKFMLNTTHLQVEHIPKNMIAKGYTMLQKFLEGGSHVLTSVCTVFGYFPRRWWRSTTESTAFSTASHITSQQTESSAAAKETKNHTKKAGLSEQIKLLNTHQSQVNQAGWSTRRSSSTGCWWTWRRKAGKIVLVLNVYCM